MSRNRGAEIKAENGTDERDAWLSVTHLSNGDVHVQAYDARGIVNLRFNMPGFGGGKCEHTHQALVELERAIEKDLAGSGEAQH